ncbi:MAG: hypothetical protein WAO61_07195 [Solirubrobacterales bacterium]
MSRPIPTYTIAAPGKLNLSLRLGPARPDGLHELVSLFDSVSLHDTLVAGPSNRNEDVVICPGVIGENLVTRALGACREAGLLTSAPLRVTIEKRVPVAAGMGGGSGDAAAALRLVAELAGEPLERFESIAFALGADVPSQLRPGTAIVRGAGERVTVVDISAARRAYVIVAQETGLPTGEVFAQADRCGLAEASVVDREHTLAQQLSDPVDLATLGALVGNDLEPAILALRPELVTVPGALRAAGARFTGFTGSGPTCFGIFESLDAARRATAELAAAGHRAFTAEPVGEEFARPRQTDRSDSPWPTSP